MSGLRQRVNNREQILREKLGFYAETGPRVGGASIMVSGTVYYMSIGLFGGDILKSFRLMCTVAGATFSGVGFKVGAYDKAVAKLTETADVSATLLGTGALKVSLAAQYAMLADDAYYIALLAIATTPPTLNRFGPSLGGAASGTFPGGVIANWGHQVGQTDLPANGALTFSSTSLPFWVGVNND